MMYDEFIGKKVKIGVQFAGISPQGIQTKYYEGTVTRVLNLAWFVLDEKMYIAIKDIQTIEIIG